MASKKQIFVGNVPIGGGAPVVVQSMTNTKTSDISATLKQIKQLEEAGCEIVRLSIPDQASVNTLKALKGEVAVPLVADIHFQWKLAVAAIKAGADKVRVNPGNIGGPEEIRAIAEVAGEYKIPLRIGVNAGSLNERIRQTNESPSRKLVASTLESIELLESMGFNNLILSLKSYNVLETIEAYREIAKVTDYPLHLGITESGTLFTGSVRSAVGLGILLAEGIGDTVRVSLAADPLHEVKVAQQILQALELRRFHPELIACPTCARCEVDLIPIAQRVEEKLSILDLPFKVAIMGCIVNGPGEARDADAGIAAGRGKGVLFKKGIPVKTIPEENFVEELIRALEELEE